MGVNTISPWDGKISLRSFGMLRRAMAKRKPDRNPFQLKIAEIMDRNKAKGWSKAALERRSDKRRRKIDTSTMNSLLKVPNPGIKTVEAFALAHDEDALELIKLALDDPPEENGLMLSPFYRLWTLYQKVGEKNLEAVNERIDELEEYLRSKEQFPSDR